MEGGAKSILILGAGLVVRPMIEYFTDHGYNVTVASRTLSRAQELASSVTSGATAVQCDVSTEEGKEKLEELIPNCDVVISMLPYLLHPYAAERAIEHNKHFLTTSYTSDAMRALEPLAKEKGLVMLNECGVDPGTDHMSAMRVIDGVRQKGGKITYFTSICGGLPAPEDNNNPLGYKFSWAPRGVLLASRNSATFLKDGKECHIDGVDLFDNYETEHIDELNDDFESYPNRNSLAYIDVYNLKDTKTMIRGTYRNKNWCTTIKKIVDLGFLCLEERNWEKGYTYFNLLKEMIGSDAEDKETLKNDVSTFLELNEDNAFVLSSLEWIGVFEEEAIPEGVNTRLDALCHLMYTKMKYRKGERDMLLMKHTFIAEYPDGKR